ncbi:hypothetical protein, partial [Sinorhizobium fredii]|uniref:hypothetical protein n=3 Tax=Rhizobium fredii TaxID=380 RepID=UPI0024E07FA6
ARQAHNLKAAGSNPAPATKQPKRHPRPTSGDFCVLASSAQASRMKYLVECRSAVSTDGSHVKHPKSIDHALGDLLQYRLLLLPARFDLRLDLRHRDDRLYLPGAQPLLDVVDDPLDIGDVPEGVRHTGENPVLEFAPADRLAVRARLAVELVDRRLALPPACSACLSATCAA